MWNLLDNNIELLCLVPGVMVPACNPSTWAIDMNHSQLYSKFENYLGFMRPYQKKRDKERSEGREKNLFKYFSNSLLPESTYLPLAWTFLSPHLHIFLHFAEPSLCYQIGVFN